VDATHQHPPEAACPPTCPGWAEGALQLFALQRRHADMLAACEAAEAVESVIVNPAAAGVVLPDYLGDEQLVRLNLVVGRDCPELLMDGWGLHCTLTFRGHRFDCALPWASVMSGVLRAPPRRRPRFQVIEGGKKDAPKDE
jgi:hypothetical protein